jgi:hypothetical protein
MIVVFHMSRRGKKDKKGVLWQKTKVQLIYIDMTWPSRLDTSPSQQRLPFENTAAFAAIGVAFQHWCRKCRKIMDHQDRCGNGRSRLISFSGVLADCENAL